MVCSDRFAEPGQVISSNTQDTSIPRRWQLPALNPVLDSPHGDLQQLGNFLGGIHPANLRRFWQHGRLFLRWHTQVLPFKVVSLGPYSLNLTEEFCTQKTPLNVLQHPKFRNEKS